MPLQPDQGKLRQQRPPIPVPLPLRVIKLGGSVLDSSNYADRLLCWLKQQSQARNLIVIGGGGPVDAVRVLAQANRYDESMLHWLCIDMMDVSFQLLASQLPELVRIATEQHMIDFLDASRTANRELCALVHLNAYYRRDNVDGQPISLPIGWDTTSDSLAALLAHRVRADELVLIKSCELATSLETNWQQLADEGIVDRAFPTAIIGLKRVRCSQLP